MKNLIDYAYQDNGTDFRKELYGAIHDKVAAAIENKKQEIAAGFMGQQEESYEDEGESLDEALHGKNVGDADSHKKAKSIGVDTVHITKTPVGERPKGIGWSLHRSGQQHNEPHDVWKSTSRKVAKHTGLGKVAEESVEELDENSTEKFAHYTGSKAKGYTVRVTDSMQPTGGLVVPVNSKSHAKQVAKDHGAKPWNF